MQNLYFMISETHTGFARALRKVGKVNYNHASIALDEDLERIYAFARTKRWGVFLARLIQENLFRFTLGKHDVVDVTIFKVPVTDEQYEEVCELIDRIHHDKEYIYNLFSVITTPVTGGFSTDRAFSCIEFVMYVLTKLGYEPDKPLPAYIPDDLLTILGDKVFYQGNLLDYRPFEQKDADRERYYSMLTVREILRSACIPAILIYRKARHHNASYQ